MDRDHGCPCNSESVHVRGITHDFIVRWERVELMMHIPINVILEVYPV